MGKYLGIRRIQVSDWMDISDFIETGVFTEMTRVFTEIAGVFTGSLVLFIIIITNLLL